MVAAICVNHLEADPLKLSKEQFPLTVSLQPLVLESFANPAVSSQGGQAMPRDDLIGYIRANDKHELDPLEAVLTQTDLIGRPGVADTGRQRRIGLGLARPINTGKQITRWMKLSRLSCGALKSVLALMALADPQFYTPGIHPLHQAMDALQEVAVGWQDGLGRAGEPVQKLFEQTVNDSLASLEENGAGLMAILSAATESAQRLQARQQRDE